jgi:hypothetical protein
MYAQYSINVKNTLDIVEEKVAYFILQYTYLATLPMSKLICIIDLWPTGEGNLAPKAFHQGICNKQS